MSEPEPSKSQKIECAKDAIIDAMEFRKRHRMDYDKGLEWGLELLKLINMRVAKEKNELEAKNERLKDALELIVGLLEHPACHVEQRDLDKAHEVLKGETNDND